MAKRKRSSYNSKTAQGRTFGFQQVDEVHPLAIIDQLIAPKREEFAEFRKAVGNILSEVRLGYLIAGLRAGIAEYSINAVHSVINEALRADHEGEAYRTPQQREADKAVKLPEKQYMPEAAQPERLFAGEVKVLTRDITRVRSHLVRLRYDSELHAAFEQGAASTRESGYKGAFEAGLTALEPLLWQRQLSAAIGFLKLEDELAKAFKAAFWAAEEEGASLTKAISAGKKVVAAIRRERRKVAGRSQHTQSSVSAAI